MKQKHRIYGMIVCLIIALFSLLLMLANENELATILVMFVGGYGLRETLDRMGLEE